MAFLSKITILLDLAISLEMNLSLLHVLRLKKCKICGTIFLSIHNKDRIEKDRKVSDRRSFSQEGERIGSDCRSTFDKRIGIGSQIRKKGIVQISVITTMTFYPFHLSRDLLIENSTFYPIIFLKKNPSNIDIPYTKRVAPMTIFYIYL